MGRVRKQPQRYGSDAVALLETLDLGALSEEEDPFSNTSIDDGNYEPPSKRSKDMESNILDDEETTTEEIRTLNFDSEFNDIQSKIDSDNQTTKFDSNQNDVKSCTCNVSEPYLRSLYENTVSILKRIEVIETSLIKNGSLITIKQEFNEKPFEKFHTYLTQNGLPLMKLDDLKSFENNLCSENFKSESVSM